MSPYRFDLRAPSSVWEARRINVVYGEWVITYDSSCWRWWLLLKCWWWVSGRPFAAVQLRGREET